MRIPFCLLLICSFLSASAFSECINPLDPSVPACPKNKTQALDDTYPAAFVTVGPGQMDAMGTEFAIKAFKINSPTRIVLSGWYESSYKQLVEQLKKEGYTSEQINQKIIFFSEGTGYQWQQDFLQPVFDSQTGTPVIRPISGYMNSRIKISDDQAYISKLASLTQKEKVFCDQGPTVGKSIPEVPTKNDDQSISWGGNMEGFPGGLCLIGDSLPKESMNSFCQNNPDFAVKIPTSWLRVAHVDEVVSVVRDNNSPPPCHYAVLRASPKKALELLNPELNPNTKMDLFVNRDENDDSTSASVCHSWEQYQERIQRSSKPIESEPSKTLKGSSIFWLNRLVSDVYAGIPIGKASYFDCRTLTNEQAYLGIMNQPDLIDANELIEQEMQKAENEIRKKATEQGCPNIKIIPVPNLFNQTVYSKKGDSKDPIVDVTLMDGRQLKKNNYEFTEEEMRQISQKQRLEKWEMTLNERTGLAIHPNPTNSVLIGNTLLFPKPKNAAFEQYLKKNVAESLKLESDFVNTWRSAHTSEGNLHCSTNTFRYCRPETSPKK